MNDEIIDDEFDDEAETRERYSFLYDGVGDNLGSGRSADDAAESQVDETPLRIVERPNYHRINELSDDLLRDLDFYRFDNFFGGRPAHNCFIDGDAHQSAKAQIFGDYWSEGELAILFADTGVGKSILATQIAQSAASGFAIEPFRIDTAAQRVAFFDLEISAEQFDRRYSNDDPLRPAKFPFHRNFIRNLPAHGVETPDWATTEASFILNSMAEFIIFSKARIVIVDNISWLNSARNAGISAPRLMKFFLRMKRELGISILLLAHTPKRRLQTPLSVNDLLGVKMTANLADSVFALGTSRFGPDVRYLKSVKNRSSAPSEPDRVATLRIEKDAAFLGMKFEGFADERDHIGWMSSPREPERMILTEKVIELHNQKFSQRQIGRKLGVSPATVNRCIKEASF